MNERNAAAAALEWDGWLDSMQHALHKGVHGYPRELLEAEIAEVLGRIDTRDASAWLNQRDVHGALLALRLEGHLGALQSRTPTTAPSTCPNASP